MPGIMQLKQNFKGGGADMGARDRAQERADRGYGDTSGPDDKGTAAAAFLPNDLNRFSARITFVSTFLELVVNPLSSLLARSTPLVLTTAVSCAVAISL